MKNIFLGLSILLLCATAPTLQAQSSRQRSKTDSVSKLVKKYLNEKAADKIYDLTNATVQKQFSKETFTAVFAQNYYPLGQITEMKLEKFSNGVGNYKTVFEKKTSTFYLGLDENNKIKELTFVPYGAKDPNK